MADESIKLTDLSIKASNFKCFADEQGFDTIKPINVIIGKNNSGKSTLLDILELVFCWKDEHNNEVVKPGASHQRAYRIALSSVLNEKFSSNTAMEFDTRSDKGASIAVSPLDKEKIHSWVLDLREFFDEPYAKIEGSECLGKFLSEKRFFRIDSDRTFPVEIVDEIGIGLGDIGRNGSGVTKLVHTLVNVEYGHPEVVEELMGDIDTILDAEAEVTDIKCRQIRSGKSGSKGKWQVLLDIDGKEIYAENFGAGLRMVLMVCLFCNSRLTEELLGPDNSKRSIAIEEPETNMHPALLRRFLKYLKGKAKGEEITFFLTTHSPILIDEFAQDEDAQILEVQREKVTDSVKRKSRVEKRDCQLHFRETVAGLGVTPADILQANCVIWVEGPSDAVYIRKWIELVDERCNNPNLYQIAFSGGSLLSWRSYDEEPVSEQDNEQLKAETKKFIEAQKLNPNNIVVLDSDIADDSSKGKGWTRDKEKARKEIEANAGFVWITKGKEIENYLTKDVLDRVFPDLEIPGFERGKSFSDWLKEANKEIVENREGRSPAKIVGKTDLAMRVVQHIEKEDLDCKHLKDDSEEEHPGHTGTLREQVEKLVEKIKEYNSYTF